MELYLIQHGAALAKEVDPERSLSPEGEEQVQIAGDALVKLGVRLDQVIASPKRRAKQTAQAVARAMDLREDTIGVLEALEPMSPPQETVQALKERGVSGATLLAGHLPSLAEIAAYLMDCQGKIAFRMGGVGCLQVDEWKRGGGKLLYYLTPEQLRVLAH